MEELEQRVLAIEKRNKKVELDKAWETSLIRKLSIAFLTYGVVLIYLELIGNENPLINAAVPAVGFLLSTLLLKSIRKMWEHNK